MDRLPSLSSLLIIAISAFGLAWVIADSKISLPGRKIIAGKLGPDSLFLAFLECPPCLSFWIGLGTGIFLLHLGFFSLLIAFFCTAISLILWTFVQ